MIGRGQEAGAFKFRSAEEVNFLSQYSSYFSRLKELGEEGPAHGLFFSVFLSSPGKMFCTDHFNFYGMRKWIFNQKISVFPRIRSFAFGWTYPHPSRAYGKAGIRNPEPEPETETEPEPEPEPEPKK